MLIDLNKTPVKLSVSEGIKKILCICSHERSGTHFLMNSISINSHYSANPYLNFDLSPLGDMINFYDSKSVENFIKKFQLLIIQIKNIDSPALSNLIIVPLHLKIFTITQILFFFIFIENLLMYSYHSKILSIIGLGTKAPKKILYMNLLHLYQKVRCRDTKTKHIITYLIDGHGM